MRDQIAALPQWRRIRGRLPVVSADRGIDCLLGADEFADRDPPVALAADELHLWLWHSEQPFPPRQVSALARDALGRLLQAYGGAGAPPPILRGEHGKPFVAEAGFPQFNLSHSGCCVVFAFARDHEIGVDVEMIGRRHSSLELARRFYAAEEAAALGALAESEREAAFMRMWTCKEAVLKALGQGLSFGLHRVRFAIGPDSPAIALQEIAAEAGRREDWQLKRFEPAAGHAGALAWRGPPLHVRTFRLHPEAAVD
ncbi:MAG: 4'-phosphopantetheinyl transferase superfamily protein [Dokdonella sp.]|nr:4'-phosphopantetheinyl transferase superfamily protein [Dokdonella sp.]MCB1571100.1 4'-phosphopantetheinyl transferase superfamily protein [Xanthomonadales bacterium]MCB1573235.1 4'-phosphopantetheinyl transferase superfamily protein [Xanthomonadales bacterium]MCB1577801.1 4'-phosphopantetheinyl transferase superfamily protein [Xanthomonadales bacterium]